MGLLSWLVGFAGLMLVGFAGELFGDLLACDLGGLVISWILWFCVGRCNILLGWISGFCDGVFGFVVWFSHVW